MGSTVRGKTAGAFRRITAGAATVALAVIGMAALAAPAQAADPPPVPDPATVTADALPTWQINGVVWSQAIIGDVVYVTGSFTRARPPGVAAGGAGEVVANNIFAYRLSTGDRVTSFSTSPGLNAQGLVIRASADGSRLYVGGDFTSVNGAARGHVAALNPADGSLVTAAGFVPPNVGGQVRGFGITPSTLYVGGNFPSANGVARTRLAAFSVSTGAMTSWAPAAAGGYVWAMTMSPDKSRVLPAGSFTTLNGQPAYGMGSLNASDATVNPWPAQEKIRVAGANGAITALKTDGGQVFGTSYAFGAGASFEGTFAVDPMSGQINWLNDCLGDTYDVGPAGDVVYNSSHQHDCSVVNGWPDTNPRVRWQKASATYSHPTGVTTKNDAYGWGSTYGLIGMPYAKILTWFPNFAFGSYTSAGQAAWAVDASPDGQWVVYGGEFPRVNNVAQQGLVRFRTAAGAPNKVGPSYTTVPSTPTPTTNAVSLTAGTARVSWGSAWDQDNETLKYEVLRDNATFVYTTTSKSNFWTLPKMGFIDTGLVPGSTHRYQVRITDPNGNTLWSPVSNTVTIGTGAQSAYAASVAGDGAEHFWRLGEPSGSSVIDYAGFDDATLNGGYTRGQTGAIGGDPDLATNFDGNTGYAVNSAPVVGPDVFSVEAWFRTTSTTGGKIISFGDQPTGTSNNYDRHAYMDPQGRIWFGVYNNGAYTVNTTQSLNDGQWHHVVGTMDPTGVTLFVDGRRIGHNGGTTAAQPYSGYWRIGGDSAWNGNPYFAGDIDDVAIYPTALSLLQVQKHYTDSGRTLNVPTRPADAYGRAVWDSSPDLYWRLGESTGTVAKDSSANEFDGSYFGGYAQGQPGAPLPGFTNTAVGLDGVTGAVASNAVVSNPRTYSEELWFKTTTTQGGKLIGFGCNQTGNSGCYDRHVWMYDSGELTFGVWTGATNTITSPKAYNDGQWHHMVATQDQVSGMKLFVDGALVGTNPQTDAQAYDGYWRVGGDTTWGGNSSNWFQGTIDEVAVYSTALSASTVSAHYQAGGGQLPNQAPTAAFTHSETFLGLSVDGSTSSDPDGTIASYAWSWGDGTADGSGATATHTYAAAGTYTVTLTVTDNRGGTATTNQSVTVTAPPANQLPTSAFTVTKNYLAVSVDGSTSSDPDGTIASYAWSWGDGTTDGSGATATHTYAAAGTYTLTLTVTDNSGGTGTSSKSVAVVANQAPTAAFTSTPTNLSVAFDGSGSADPDGTIASYAWSWGDGTADGTGATPTHGYAAGGTYPVTLTVTDNGGRTGTVTHSVTVTGPPNQLPTASFTHTESALATSVNGSASIDPDGTIASYAWSWGDGTADGSGVTTSHTYAAAGTYPVTLTVTDNSGGTGTATASVTVVAAPANPLFASDDFGRTTTAGWGTADLGGSWTGTTSSAATVSGGVGRLTMAAAGSGPQLYLGSVSSSDTDLQVAVSIDKLATGGTNGVDLGFVARRVVGQGDYRASVKIAPSGAVSTALVRTSSTGVQTPLKAATVLPGVTYTAGMVLNVRVQAEGTSPTTLRLKVWRDGTTEPTAWQVTATDTTAGLQVAGSVGVHAYLSGSVTNAPMVARYDTFRVKKASLA